MHWIQDLIAFLNQPLVKAGVVALVTWLLRRWPKFVNEAVPIVTMIGSLLMTIAGWFAGQAPPTTISAGYSVAMFLGASSPWWQSLIFDGILPWLMGYGANRAAGHTKEFFDTGGPDAKPGQIIRK